MNKSVSKDTFTWKNYVYLCAQQVAQIILCAGKEEPENYMRKHETQLKRNEEFCSSFRVQYLYGLVVQWGELNGET